MVTVIKTGTKKEDFDKKLSGLTNIKKFNAHIF